VGSALEGENSNTPQGFVACRIYHCMHLLDRRTLVTAHDTCFRDYFCRWPVYWVRAWICRSRIYLLSTPSSRNAEQISLLGAYSRAIELSEARGFQARRRIGKKALRATHDNRSDAGHDVLIVPQARLFFPLIRRGVAARDQARRLPGHRPQGWATGEAL